MKTLKETRLAAILGGRGAYITLAAFAVLSAGAGVIAYDRASKKVETPSIYERSYEAPDFDIAAADKKQEGIERESSAVTPISSSEVRADRGSVSESSVHGTSVPDTQPNVMPVNGEIIEPYSGGELVKSETLGVWKTHDGVDIKADRGTPVRAMNRGEVTKVAEDPLWGYTVIIDHGSGIMGYYYSLSEAVAVKEGDKVQSGQTIGAVGDTAECEAAEPSHLHFALKRNGDWTDPIEYISPISK